jgi:translation initiation factor 2B subunit (eIF-2B alpha/beta/delta family)
MLSKRIRNKVARLREDNRSGAADITLAAIRIFRDYLRTCDVKDKGEFLQDVRELCGGVMFVQSAMFSVRNTCFDILSALSRYRNGDDLDRAKLQLDKKLEKLARHISHAHERIADDFSRVLPKNARLLTISYSSTVTGVLKELKRRGKEFEVIAMESRPMLEGRRTAEELARSTIKTTLIADAALGQYVKEVDAAVVGADTVYIDGSAANKVGTYPLAVCLREARKPLYVLADSFKISTENSRSFIIEEREADELLKNPVRGLSVRNFYFELVPARYISAIITEKWIISPRRFGKLIKSQHSATRT